MIGDVVRLFWLWRYETGGSVFLVATDKKKLWLLMIWASVCSLEVDFT